MPNYFLQFEKKSKPAEQPQGEQNVVFVEKIFQLKDRATLIWFSNGSVQVNFQDHTEIMLSSETKVVTYVNKRGERSTYPLNSAMESANLEMVKRLKYTKDILTHMLNQNAGNLNR